jgi:hypothetical protein
MKRFDSIPPRADFAYQQLVAPQKVSGAAMHDTRGYFGLRLNKTMPFGCLRDKEGHIYAAVRALMAPGATPNPDTFRTQAPRAHGATIRLDKPKMAARAATALPIATLDGDIARWSARPDDEGAHWEVTASGERMSWREEGLFEIGGPLIGHGMQWYLPGVDWGTFYVSQLYDVAGRCEGRPVKGVIAVDQAYLAEGGAIHFKKDLIVNKNMHVLWWSFATIYQDGTFDAGSFMVGHENVGYAIFQSEQGDVRTTTDIECRVSHKPDSYFLDSAEIILDGEEVWEFVPDPMGEMVDFVGGFPITAQQEGRWRRVGDRRTPDRSFGWGESDRRNGSARNVRGARIEASEREVEQCRS